VLKIQRDRIFAHIAHLGASVQLLLKEYVAELTLSLQFLQQYLCLLQVRCVKSFGEPPVARRQQVVGVLALALGQPQASAAGAARLSLVFPCPTLYAMFCIFNCFKVPVEG